MIRCCMGTALAPPEDRRTQPAAGQQGAQADGVSRQPSGREISVNSMSQKDANANQSQNYRERFDHFTHPCYATRYVAIDRSCFKIASSAWRNGFVAPNTGAGPELNSPAWGLPGTGQAGLPDHDGLAQAAPASRPVNRSEAGAAATAATGSRRRRGR